MDANHFSPSGTPEAQLWALWERCLNVAEAIGPDFADHHWADVLIAESRRAYAELLGAPKDGDCALAAILDRISTERPHPSARVFEAALRAALPPAMKAWVN